MKKSDLIILFGSKAKGREGKMSDTDIAVLSDHELDVSDKAEIAARFAPRVGGHEDKTDVVDLRTASPLLQHEIAKYGKLLEGDPLDFLLFKITAWRQYRDSAKLRLWQKTHLKKQIYGT